MNEQMEIRTPEGIVFPLRIATPVTRFVAWIIDYAVVMAAFSALQMLLMIGQPASRDVINALVLIGYFVLTIGYGIVLEWAWRGQTIGKRLLRLRVTDEQGHRLHFSQIFMRNLLRFVDNLPLFYLVGGAAALMSNRGQRFGDLAASTVVIHSPKQQRPDLSRIMGGKFNSFRALPHLCARLRQKVSAPLADIALSAVLRRDELEPNARLRLFAELTNHFRALVTFPVEIAEGLPDEQYVRNAVEVVFS